MISPKVEALITALIQREGGYVNHSSDRGGPTNWGITQGTLSAWRKKPASIAAVQALTQDEARDIYRDSYFYNPGFNMIPDPEFQEFMFDFAVNSGPGAAVRALQTSLDAMGLQPGPIDGGFGPKTHAALMRATGMGPELYYRTKCERYELFLRFIGHDPEQAVFATGWANRLDELNDKS